MKRIFIAGLLSMSLSTAAFAGSNTINMSQFPNKQQLFGDLIKDLGAAMSYRAVTPAEPLGILLGIDVGVELTGTKLKNANDSWKKATEGNGKSNLYMGKIHVHKGLPMGIDVGAYYGSVADSNIKSLGGEISYAILSGTAVSPALALRGTYTRLSGVTDLDLNTAGLELSISKGFLMLTPYAGVGAVYYNGQGTPGTTNPKFDSESDTLAKYFLGVNFNLGLVNFAAEADKTGDNSSYSAKFGLRW
jgi:hypothetical protein